MDYRLIVDSCCETVPELIEKTDFRRVPLSMALGSEIYQDDERLNPLTFLRKLREFSGKAMSSCPSPLTYAAAFAADKLNLVVTLSAQLSGSYSAAVTSVELAEQSSKAPVLVVNSRSASAGELLTALKLREIAEKATGLEEIREKAEQVVREIHTFFILEDLGQLARSGRMSRITAKLGSVMQIRPILGSDGEGNIKLFGKVQGTRNASLRLCAMVGEHMADTAGKTAVISHCGNEEQARKLKTLIEERYRFARVLLAKTGGISSMYAGLGGIILAF